MGRISQEFYCGECKGYFAIRLNMSLNHEVEIVCPNCKHEHRRRIEDGQIFERGRHITPISEKILTSMANYSKTPITQRMRDAHEKQIYSARRDGVPYENQPMMEQWLSVAARERGEE